MPDILKLAGLALAAIIILIAIQKIETKFTRFQFGIFGIVLCLAILLIIFLGNRLDFLTNFTFGVLIFIYVIAYIFTLSMIIYGGGSGYPWLDLFIPILMFFLGYLAFWCIIGLLFSMGNGGNAGWP